MNWEKRRKIPAALRAMVARRAEYRCEYCRSSEVDSVDAFEVDHIFPIKHGGPTEPDNLAYTCIICTTGRRVAGWLPQKILPGSLPRFSIHAVICGKSILIYKMA